MELKIYHMFGMLLTIGVLSKMEIRKLMSLGLVGVGAWWFSWAQQSGEGAEVKVASNHQSNKLLEDEIKSKGYKWKTVWASEKPRSLKYVSRNPDFMNIVKELRWTKRFYIHWLQRLIDGLDSLQRLYDGMLSGKLSIDEFGDVFTSLRWEIVRYLHGARHSYPMEIRHSYAVGAPEGNIHAFFHDLKVDFIDITRSMSDYIVRSADTRPVSLQNGLNAGRSKAQFMRNDSQLTSRS